MKNLSTSDIAQSTSRDERERATQEEARRNGDLRRPSDGPEAQVRPPEEERPRLLPKGNEEELRSRWTEIQTGFVDEPRRAVKDADELVAEAMRQVAELFAKERANLEQQWDRHDDVSTEDLRIALQRYRSFFGRLLSL